MSIEKYLKDYGPDQIIALYEGKSSFKKAIMAAAIAGTLGAGMYFRYIKTSPEFTPMEKSEIIANIRNMPMNPDELSQLIPNYQGKVDAVKDFLEWSSTRFDEPWNNKFPSKRMSIDPEYIVQLCAYYNYDVKLLLSQLHVESHCGITPRAYRCNNPFSYGQTDDGKDVIFPSQNEALEPYIKLVQKNYLMTGTENEKTVSELMKNYVNYYGARYAKSKDYERQLHNTYHGYLTNPKYNAISDGIWSGIILNNVTTPKMYIPHRDHTFVYTPKAS